MSICLCSDLLLLLQLYAYIADFFYINEGIFLLLKWNTPTSRKLQIYYVVLVLSSKLSSVVPDQYQDWWPIQNTRCCKFGWAGVVIDTGDFDNDFLWSLLEISSDFKFSTKLYSNCSLMLSCFHTNCPKFITVDCITNFLF